MEPHSVTMHREGDASRLEFAPEFNAAAAFVDRHRQAGRQEQVFLRTDEGLSVTYGQLAEAVNRCGNALRAQEIARGERVLMVIRDSPAFAYVFWGAIKAGILPVPLNTLLRAHDFRFLMEDSRAAAIVYSPEFAAEVEPALQAARHRPRCALPTAGAGTTLESLMARAGTELAPAPTTPEDDCYWLYSSGSTGRPKGVVHRHRNLPIVCQNSGVEAMGVRGADVVYSASKMFFAYGLGNSLTVPLWVGASVVLSGARPTPELVFEVIETFRPTLFYGVPTLYAGLLKAMEQRERDLSSLRLCYSSGEALPAGLLERWRERTGLLVLDVMGTTESCYCLITSREDAWKPGYTGLPVPGLRTRIVDEQDQDVPPGRPGQLMVKSRAAARCYWERPEHTAQTMLAGDWLRTGDTFVRDEEGFFQYQGRNDDMLKVGGIWCSPFEIESRLIEHPRVLEAAVVGRTDGDRLVKPEAWVVLKEPGDAGEALAGELLGLCKSNLAPYKYPRWFNFVAELPKTATGKIQRVKLRDRAEDAPVPAQEVTF